MSFLKSLFPRPSLARGLRDAIAKVDALSEYKTTVSGEHLTLPDWRVSLCPRLLSAEEFEGSPYAHLHVQAKMGSATFDSCVFGLGETSEQALAQALHIWSTQVGSLLYSLLACRPLADSTHFENTHDAWAIPRMHGFLSPVFSRGFSEPRSLVEAPFFSHVRTLIPHPEPSKLYLIKSNVLRAIDEGWSVTLEVNGHELSQRFVLDSEFADIPDFGMATRFALAFDPR